MRIGFIGLGIMGEPMCCNVVKKHDDKVFVYDIRKERIEIVARYGAIGCDSVAEVARNSDVIITVVPRSEHALEVYSEILPVADSSKICIDMSTIDIDMSLFICKMLNEKGAYFLDAPIVKSQAAARMGDVGIYVGGDLDIYRQIKPILQYMGRSVMRMGENGKGLLMKICNNALTAQIQNGVNETLALALSQGIDIDKFGAAVSYGFGQNAYFDSKQMALRYKDYTTQLSLENMAKDLGICQRLAERLNVSMPGLDVAAAVYEDALKEGDPGRDYCATLDTVKKRMHKDH